MKVPFVDLQAQYKSIAEDIDVAARYRDLLKDTPAVTPIEASGMRHVYHFSVHVCRHLKNIVEI